MSDIIRPSLDLIGRTLLKISTHCLDAICGYEQKLYEFMLDNWDPFWDWGFAFLSHLARDSAFLLGIFPHYFHLTVAFAEVVRDSIVKNEAVLRHMKYLLNDDTTDVNLNVSTSWFYAVQLAAYLAANDACPTDILHSIVKLVEKVDIHVRFICFVLSLTLLTWICLPKTGTMAPRFQCIGATQAFVEYFLASGSSTSGCMVGTPSLIISYGFSVHLLCMVADLTFVKVGIVALLLIKLVWQV